MKRRNSKRRNPDHKQINIKTKKGYNIQIDEGLVPLIKLLDDFDIETINSCEENKPGIVWIQFASCNNLIKFLNLIGNPNNELYERIIQGYGDIWNYAFNVKNFGVKETIINEKVIEEYTGKNKYHIFPSIRFPKKDLTLIIKILKR